MTRGSVKEYLKAVELRYRKAHRKGKSRLLDQAVQWRPGSGQNMRPVARGPARVELPAGQVAEGRIPLQA